MTDLATDLAADLATDLATNLAGGAVAPLALAAWDWWDADQGVSDPGGDHEWVGRIAGSVVGQPTVSKQPTVTASYGSWSGGAMEFDGAGDAFEVSGASWLPATDYTFAFTLDQGSPLQNSYIMDIQSGRLICTPNHGGVGLGANGVGSSDGSTWVGDSGIATTGPQYLVFTGENGVGRTVRKDGAEIATTGSFTQRALGGNIAIGAFHAGTSQYFKGAIRDVVIFDRALNAGDLATLETWLAGRVV